MNVPLIPPAAVLRLPPNPVWRSYRGGSVLRKFRGDAGPHAAEDNHFPEDWLASSVIARNGVESRGPREGLSAVEYDGELIDIPTFLVRAPEYCPRSVGSGDSLGVLLKLLDAADRLHLQAHPDDGFARTHLGGTAGKTECWHILATRSDDASILLGFQRPPTCERWREMIAAQDLPAMLACFDPIPVRPGDTYVIPAGVPHAIGAGVFMMELQQPSDWVVRCEFSVGGYTLPESARFMGLSLDDCLDIFDYQARPADAFRQTPTLLGQTADFTHEEIIGADYQRFFRLQRLRGRGPANWSCDEPCVVIVTAGAGRLGFGVNATPASRGDTLLLPASAALAQWTAELPGEWELLVAYPPLRA